ncbi:MAG: M24 family metallopeptidase [Chloroflexi bacterium]|nr:M24 family metallopeptidase [Chloroflexota bacterium]
MPTFSSVFAQRRERAAAACRAAGVAALLVGPGSDLAYLAGYRIHTSERLSCLVITARGATLVVPELEAPRARAAAPDLALETWQETEDPIACVSGLIDGDGAVLVGDQLWATFVLRAQRAMPARRFDVASLITRDLRAVKDSGEIAALRAVGAAADRAFARIRTASFEGRRERDIADDLAAALKAEGHDEVAFTIVASGPNGASPHHATGERTDVDREVRLVHDVVRRAQEAGYRAAREGARAASVDDASRAVIEEAGYGRWFVHRTGHGIGLDGHEHPYLVRGNDERLSTGMAFSIEPGIYLPGRFGVRIEDIAFLDASGAAQPLNAADHALAIVV